MHLSSEPFNERTNFRELNTVLCYSDLHCNQIATVFLKLIKQAISISLKSFRLFGIECCIPRSWDSQHYGCQLFYIMSNGNVVCCCKLNNTWDCDKYERILLLARRILVVHIHIFKYDVFWLVVLSVLLKRHTLAYIDGSCAVIV